MAAVWHRRTFLEMTSDRSGNIFSIVLTQGSIIITDSWTEINIFLILFYFILFYFI